MSVVEGSIGAFPRRLLVGSTTGRRRAGCSARRASAPGYATMGLRLSERPLRARAPAEAVTDDAFLGGALSILQPRSGLPRRHRRRAAGGAVRGQSRASRCSMSERASASSGSPWRAACPTSRVTLVEREPDLAALARRNIARNGLAARVHVLSADVPRPLSELPGAGRARRKLRSRRSPIRPTTSRAAAPPPTTPQGRRQCHAAQAVARALGPLHGRHGASPAARHA